jgi:hypothetical protein
MKNLAVILLAVSISGCATLGDWLPSFWDDNQSAKIIDIRQQVQNINCDTTEDQRRGATGLASSIQWFKLYSESKGMLQKDVLRLVEPMDQTVAEWRKRAESGEASTGYCKIKKSVLKVQSDKAATAVLGRY